MLAVITGLTALPASCNAGTYPAKQQAHNTQKTLCNGCNATLFDGRDCPADEHSNVWKEESGDRCRYKNLSQRPRRTNEHLLPCVTCHKTGDRKKTKYATLCRRYR